MSIPAVAASWAVLSLPFAVLVGRFISAGDPDQSDRGVGSGPSTAGEWAVPTHPENEAQR